jgi:hypothetical protein
MEITPIPITSLNRKVALTEKNADNGLGYILSGGPVLTLEFTSAIDSNDDPISQPFDFNENSTSYIQSTTSGFGSGISFSCSITDGVFSIDSIESGGDNYFLGDTIDFIIEGRNVTITLTVTELEDLGINKGKGVVVYYDRYDQVLYYTTYIGEEEFSFTANGEIYEPTELPTDYKEKPSGTVADTTYSDDLLTIRVTYDVPPNKIITSTATIETYIGNYLQVTISDLGLSQSLTVSCAEIDPDDELTIKITMVEPLPYDEEILIDILHLNGLEYWNSSQITIGPIANPFGGRNYIPTDGYTEVTDAPYFIDESYNITIYTADDLTAMGLDTNEKSYTITSLGFPFHLTETTDSGNVTNEDVADGVFKLAAKVVNLPFDSAPSPDTITKNGLTLEIANSVLIGDNGFKQDIINPFVDKMVGEVIIIGETKRYVFFPVDPFVYSGGDLAIIFYMDGAGASWAAGYTEMNQSDINVGEVINMTTPSESEGQLDRKTSIVIKAYEILPPA